MKKVLTYYLKPHYLNMLLGFTIKFMGTIMDLCLPWILAYMIDTVIPMRDKPQLYRWGFLMILCSIFAIFFNIIANRMAAKVSADTIERVRNDLFEKTMYLSGSQMDEFTKPSLISRLTEDTYNLHQMLGRMQRMGVRSPILLIGGIIITMTLDLAMSGVLISTLPLLVILLVLVTKKSIPMFRRLQEALDRFVRLIREDIAGIRVIKALSKNEYERMRFDEKNKALVACDQAASVTTAVINPITNIILNLGLVCVIFVGAYRVNQGISEVGKILAFMTYFTIILHAMMSISKMFTITSKAMTSADRIMEVLDRTPDLNEIPLKQKKDGGYIEFDRVSFSYDKVESNLEEISFSLKRGETLGIIGATGAGKSTIANLLMRFYDVDAGGIYIGGEDIRSMPLHKLRGVFGSVFQNDTIFEGSITDNIDLYRGLSKAQIQEAVLYARAKEFVEQREADIEEILNIKGANLSGGQKQRILIARALAAHPEILILDDASSALDYKTHAALRKEIKEHFSDTTCIMITQRISSIAKADHILVLEEGRMVGYGTHEELLESCGIYQEICDSQMGGVS